MLNHVVSNVGMVVLLSQFDGATARNFALFLLLTAPLRLGPDLLSSCGHHLLLLFIYSDVYDFLFSS